MRRSRAGGERRSYCPALPSSPSLPLPSMARRSAQGRARRDSYCSSSEEGMADRGSRRAARKSKKQGPINKIGQGGHQGGPAALARAGEAGKARSDRPQQRGVGLSQRQQGVEEEGQLSRGRRRKIRPTGGSGWEGGGCHSSSRASSTAVERARMDGCCCGICRAADATTQKAGLWLDVCARVRNTHPLTNCDQGATRALDGPLTHFWGQRGPVGPRY